jgi:hypothetical protein
MGWTEPSILAASLVCDCSRLSQITMAISNQRHRHRKSNLRIASEFTKPFWMKLEKAKNPT